MKAAHNSFEVVSLYESAFVFIKQVENLPQVLDLVLAKLVVNLVFLFELLNVGVDFITRLRFSPRERGLV